MYSILIIEDDKRVANLLKTGLEENGYHTMVAYDGAMGLRLFQSTLFSWLFRILFFPNWMALNSAKKYAKQIRISLYLC